VGQGGRRVGRGVAVGRGGVAAEPAAPDPTLWPPSRRRRIPRCGRRAGGGGQVFLPDANGCSTGRALRGTWPLLRGVGGPLHVVQAQAERNRGSSRLAHQGWNVRRRRLAGPVLPGLAIGQICGARAAIGGIDATLAGNWPDSPRPAASDDQAASDNYREPCRPLDAHGTWERRPRDAARRRGPTDNRDGSCRSERPRPPNRQCSGSPRWLLWQSQFRRVS
jgi:hypothetical protein